MSKRSIAVTLTLLGLTGAVAAGPYLPPGQTILRNQYRDRESCERDYSPSQCEQSGGGSGGSGGGGGRWRGPAYQADRSLPDAKADPGPGRYHLASSIQSSVRGGFGRIGSALRAIG